MSAPWLSEYSAVTGRLCSIAHHRDRLYIIAAPIERLSKPFSFSIQRKEVDEACEREHVDCTASVVRPSVLRPVGQFLAPAGNNFRNAVVENVRG